MLRNFSLFFFSLFLSFGIATNAMAGSYDIKEMTPAIQNAINNRQARYQSLQSFKASQQIGENNQGYVAALQGASGEAASVVSGENSDRSVIYQAIVSQNNLGGQGLAQVQTVFAEVQREKASSGESIQLPNGSWVQK